MVRLAPGEPTRTICAFECAAFSASGWKSVASAGMTVLYAVFTPPFCRAACAVWISGVANGSSTVTYAALAGRREAGRLRIQCTKLSRLFFTGAGWTKKKFLKPCWKTDGPPPAGAGKAKPHRCATRADGMVSSEENGPKVRSTLSEVISLV